MTTNYLSYRLLSPVTLCVLSSLQAIEYKGFVRISYRGLEQRVHNTTKRVRIRVCNCCRAVVGEINAQTGKLCKQTDFHHEQYHVDDVLLDTIELCVPCHKIYEKEKEEIDGEKRMLLGTDIIIEEIPQKRKTKSEEIIDKAKYYEELHGKGIYNEPISHICETICTELRAKGLYNRLSLVHKVLDSKYKQMKFTPRRI